MQEKNPINIRTFFFPFYLNPIDHMNQKIFNKNNIYAYFNYTTVFD